MASRGDIYYIDLPPEEAKGKELVGPHWHVVVSKNGINQSPLETVIVVPLTSLKNKETGQDKDLGPYRQFRIRVHPLHITWEPGCKHTFAETGLAKTEQVRYMSVDRLGEKCGTMNAAGLGGINAGLADVLAIPVPDRTSPLSSGPLMAPLKRTN